MPASLRYLCGLSLGLLATTGCIVEDRVVVREPAPRPYAPPHPEAVVSVVIEPPIGQPEPIGCPWAPPPMLVEVPPPPPFEGAIWTGGYWVWHGTWVWAHGRWAAPPRYGYHWHPPYYENRDGVVVFVTGHWMAPGVVFVPPPPSIRIAIEVGAPGVVPGPRPMGPSGVFVPPPPGSRAGLIIPAPVGTPPAVVTSAPPVVNVGMRITNNVTNNHTTIVNNITNVTIVAPPTATASGQAVHSTVPSQAHLAAALPPVVKTQAPPPASAKPVQPFVPGQRNVSLPPAQPVHVAPAAQPPAQPPAHPVAPAKPAPQPIHPVPPPSAQPAHPAPPVAPAKPAPRPAQPEAKPILQPKPAQERPAPARLERLKEEPRLAPRTANPPKREEVRPAPAAPKPATQEKEPKKPAQGHPEKGKDEKDHADPRVKGA